MQVSLVLEETWSSAWLHCHPDKRLEEDNVPQSGEVNHKLREEYDRQDLVGDKCISHTQLHSPPNLRAEFCRIRIDYAPGTYGIRIDCILVCARSYYRWHYVLQFYYYILILPYSGKFLAEIFFAKARANVLQKKFARFIFAQPALGEIKFQRNLPLRSLHSPHATQKCDVYIAASS